ncbi:hypothetical protein D3C87_691950 [compost metagenome]
MSWTVFDYTNAKQGIFWLLVKSQEIDVDVDNDGQLVGVDTGEIRTHAVLARVETDDEGHPQFFPVDQWQFGRIDETDHVTHFAEVAAPTLPGQ